MLTTLICKKLPSLFSTRKPTLNGSVPFTHLRTNNQNPRSPQPPHTKTTQEMLTPSPIWWKKSPSLLSITKPTLYAFVPLTHLKMNKQNPRSAQPWKKSPSLLSTTKPTINAPLLTDPNKKCFCTQSSPESPSVISREEADLDQTMQKMRSGVLYLECYHSRNGIVMSKNTGTAFLVDKNIAASNAHVCCKPFEIVVRGGSTMFCWVKGAIYGRFPNQEIPFRLTILAVNTQNDTCLLGLPSGMADPELHFCAKLCFEMPLLGQSLFFIGNPGIAFCIKRGMFSCVRTRKELSEAGLHFSAMMVDALEFEAVAGPGTSGSPVFDRLRRVFAMVFGGNSLVEEDAGALSMYAVSACHIKQLLEWLKIGQKRGSVFVYNDGFDEGYDDSYVDEIFVDNRVLKQNRETEPDTNMIKLWNFGNRVFNLIRQIAGNATPYKGKGALKVSRRKLGKRTKKLAV